METMVFIDPPKMKATPFTTSEVVARFAGVQHHAVQQLCAKYQADLEEFGIFTFEMRKLDGRGRPETVYHLDGKQVRPSMTWRPEPEMTERQIEKELQRQMVLFDESCHGVTRASGHTDVSEMSDTSSMDGYSLFPVPMQLMSGVPVRYAVSASDSLPVTVSIASMT